MEFTIEVQDRRNGQWRERKRGIEASTANAAVKQYIVSCKRPTKGHARSKSGKLFRAVEAA